MVVAMALGTLAHKALQRATGALPTPGSCCLGRLLYEQQCHSHGSSMESNRWVHAVSHTSVIMIDNVHAIFLPGHAFSGKLSVHTGITGLAGRVKLHTCSSYAWIWRQP